MQRAAITEATIDVFIMKPIVFYLLFPVMAYYVDIDQLHPPPLTWQSWPAWRRMLGDWVLMEAVYSLLFYCAHRLLHAVPFLYKHIVSETYSLHYINFDMISCCFKTTSINCLYFMLHAQHKVHHSFNRSVAFGAQYHHPLESVFGALYVIAGAALVRPTLCTFALYLATRLGETIDAHCGYDVPWRALYLWSDVYPWGSGARMHDYHHSHNRGECRTAKPLSHL